jgi:AmmeMemoRadiSam system protein A
MTGRYSGASLLASGISMDDVYLPVESQQKLLALSRQTLNDFVRRIEHQLPRVHDSYLQSCDYGAFVSLFKEEQLRGCVGSCAPEAPLLETVIKMTKAAASQDDRVVPIRQDELNAIHIDITVLSPLAAVDDPLLLEAGKHGLYIARDDRRGVLLPQVATRYRWDLKTFLEQTCLKAGLPKGAWHDRGTQLWSFTVLIIEEH